MIADARWCGRQESPLDKAVYLTDEPWMAKAIIESMTPNEVVIHPKTGFFGQVEAEEAWAKWHKDWLAAAKLPKGPTVWTCLTCGLSIFGTRCPQCGGTA